jgi:DNA primase
MLDISDFLYRQFDDVRETENDFHICCPFCDSDEKYHLAIAKEKQAVHCFKCGYKGSWIKFVIDRTGLPYFLALAELYRTPKIREDSYKELFQHSGKVFRDTLKDLPTDFEGVLEGEGIMFSRARKYLRRRGISKELWKFYNLGVCQETHPYRVVIPVEYGYYQARAMLKWMEPKYINPDVEARDYIFNSQALELYDEVPVLEGAFSAMAIGKNAVALIGKEPVKEKVERLVNSSVKRFCIGLDYDAARWTVMLADKLSRAGKEVAMWNFQDARDPADGGVYEELSYDLKNILYMRMKQV